MRLKVRPFPIPFGRSGFSIFEGRAVNRSDRPKYISCRNTDIGIYRFYNGGWYIIPSSNPGTPYGVGWGDHYCDIPVTMNIWAMD